MKIGIGSPGAGARSEHYPCRRFAGRRASQDSRWRCKVMGVCSCVCVRCLLACVRCLRVCVCVIVCGGHYFFICNPRTCAHGSSLLHDIIRGRQSACRDISVCSMRKYTHLYASAVPYRQKHKPNLRLQKKSSKEDTLKAPFAGATAVFFAAAGKFD